MMTDARGRAPLRCRSAIRERADEMLLLSETGSRIRALYESSLRWRATAAHSNVSRTPGPVSGWPYDREIAVVRNSSTAGVEAVMPLRPSSVGGSGSFLVLADDGERYWCKALNNFQGERIPITEQIVGRLGELVGAPVCRPELVRMDAIAGWEFRPASGRFVEPGWAHGSRAVEPALETHTLNHRGDDDNARRQCGIYALCDWLAGGDVQWLYAVSEDNAYYSHDHGYYLAGPDWTASKLGAVRDAPFSISIPPDHLDAAEMARLADALDALSRQDIENELSKLPNEWPVSNEELDAVADFAESRRAPVASRLRTILS